MNLSDFIHEGWNALKLTPAHQTNWHIDAMTERLEAVSAGQIRKLQIWLPPTSSKTLTCGVFWPAWEWTFQPQHKWLTATYDMRLSIEVAGSSRQLMLTDWYRERWGDQYQLIAKSDRSFPYFRNDKGGSRVSTSPGSPGFGSTVNRILLDDPCGFPENMQRVNDWYDGSVTHTAILGCAQVIVTSRVGSDDLAAHAMKHGDWEVLCLPERYETGHPFAWRGDRRKEGELLWPESRDEQRSNVKARKLGTVRADGLLQQRPG